MLPVIALVGRPNVGKSTLFNRLTRSRDALVADFSGLTRDRQYGDGKIGDHPYLVVDTGGILGGEEGLDELTAQQAWQAVEEADSVFFLVDARDGLVGIDEEIAIKLRRTGRKVVLVLNKVDGMDADIMSSSFYSLGLGEPYAISASHGRGVGYLMDEVLQEYYPEQPLDEEGESADEGEDDEDDGRIKVALIGRPNVGKSTLINRILGEDRVLAYDMPGTTRDSIFIPFDRDDRHYTLIDTAGVRRRSRIKEVIEKFSIVKTMKAIYEANVVILLYDAHEGLAEQDVSLAGYILEQGRALIIAVNKWDGIDDDQRDKMREDIERKLPFASFVEVFFISALHGSNVGNLYEAIDRAYKSAMVDMSTSELTRMLEDAVKTHPPHLVRGRRIKLRYAHQGGQNPPRIIIHGNQTDRVPATYIRYLSSYFLKRLALVGTPVSLEFRTGDNPYEGRRNKLTPRQQYKRKRMMRHVKKS
ncbi:MAG: ribosome biogenesis GTPase Der [Gammaproteobacteria bacterium]|nr:ribosome biogenesis GTPase Der [Gammaproteobacteria bacterium]